MDLTNSFLINKYIAHRGYHDEENPENSLGAFQRAVDAGYAIELDVHQISDGTLVVFHDETLSRITGKDGYTEQLTKETLSNYYLNGTSFTIPTLEEVLKLVDGKVGLLIEVKNTGKVGKLESALYEILKNYKGEFAIQSFNPFVLEWFYKNAPEIPRGQLSSFFTNTKLSLIKKFALKRMIYIKKFDINFISYEAKRLPNRFVNKYRNLPLLAWTIRSQSEYMEVAKHCDNIIFEGFTPVI